MRLKWHTDLCQNVDFRGVNFNEIEFRLSVNNQTDNSKFFINFLHVWSWWEIIACMFSFQIYLFIVIYSRVTFINQRGDLCEIIIFSLTVFVPFVVSVHMRKSVKWWRKHDCTSFIDVLSKGFISNSVKGCDFDFCTGCMHNRGGWLFVKMWHMSL